MSEIVDTTAIETIVGRERHPVLHFARRVDTTAYVMHSAACLAATPDLRECRFSLALDRGCDERVGRAGVAQVAHVNAEGLLDVVLGDVHTVRMVRGEERTDGDLIRYDGVEVTVECSTPDLCTGWAECDEDHDFTDEEAAQDAEDTGTHTFHGVEHEYNTSVHGWTVPFEGCILVESIRWSDGLSESAGEVFSAHGPGPHAVAAEWSGGGEDPTLVWVDAL